MSRNRLEAVPVPEVVARDFGAPNPHQTSAVLDHTEHTAYGFDRPAKAVARELAGLTDAARETLARAGLPMNVVSLPAMYQAIMATREEVTE